MQSPIYNFLTSFAGLIVLPKQYSHNNFDEFILCKLQLSRLESFTATISKSSPSRDAHDTQIFTSSHDTEDLIDKLNSDLVNVMDWLTVNKLQSHAKKTKFMLIGSAHNLSAKGNEVTDSIIMNNSIIESVLSQKCLGVDLDKG